MHRYSKGCTFLIIPRGVPDFAQAPGRSSMIGLRLWGLRLENHDVDEHTELLILFLLMCVYLLLAYHKSNLPETSEVVILQILEDHV